MFGNILARWPPAQTGYRHISKPNPFAGEADALSGTDFALLQQAVETRKCREEVGVCDFAAAAAMWRPKSSGSDWRPKGDLSTDNICIAVAIDSRKNVVVVRCGHGKPSTKRIKGALQGHIAEESEIFHDMERSRNSLAKAVKGVGVALMTDDVSRLPYLKWLSNTCVRTIMGAITLSMCIKFIAVSLSVMGVLNPVTGALVHNCGSCFVVMLAALLYDRKCPGEPYPRARPRVKASVKTLWVRLPSGPLFEKCHEMTDGYV